MENVSPSKPTFRFWSFVPLLIVLVLKVVLALVTYYTGHKFNTSMVAFAIAGCFGLAIYAYTIEGTGTLAWDALWPMYGVCMTVVAVVVLLSAIVPMRVTS